MSASALSHHSHICIALFHTTIRIYGVIELLTEHVASSIVCVVIIRQLIAALSARGVPTIYVLYSFFSIFYVDYVDACME